MTDRKTVRFEEGMLRRLEDEGNVSETIQEALKLYYDMRDKGVRPPTEKEISDGVVEPVKPKVSTVGRTRGYKHDDFMIPVGDVLMPTTYVREVDGHKTYAFEPTTGYEWAAQSRIWWCPPSKITHVEKLAEPFTSSGFIFMTGLSGNGTDYDPEVIENADQERKRGGLYVVSTKMIPALVGDRKVWLEIIAPEKALEILRKNSAIPCALRCDVMRYSTDERYREAFDLADYYFKTYYVKGTPVALDTTSRHDDYLRSVLGDD